MEEPGIEFRDASCSVFYFMLPQILIQISGELSVVVAVGRHRISVPLLYFWIFLTKIKETVANHAFIQFFESLS